MKIKIVNDYRDLLKQIQKTFIAGQERIEAQRVKTYWKTGRIIHTHILKHKGRAEYGVEVMKQLAHDLNISQRVLERCIQFAKIYPRLPITAARPQFSWSHYRTLITVSNDKKRTQLEKAAILNQWSTDELAARIKEERPLTADHREPTPNPKPLTLLRGELYTYQLTKRPTIASDSEPELLVDLGFSNFRKVDHKLLSKLSAGQIVESRWVGDDYKFYATERTVKDLYTYQAFVEKVIDGDTLKVRVDLGFDTWSRQILRLRGIDCPEMDTKEGQAAKAFVQSYIKEADRIIIRSSKSDKYDRYLADVFIPLANDEIRDASDAEKDIYLNNLLLENGYAKRWE